MTTVVGFSFPSGHDAAVAVITDGRLVFATEEERYSRHKHALGELPVNSMLRAFEYLQGVGVKPDEIDAFALPFDLNFYRVREKFTILLIMLKSLLGADYMPSYRNLAGLTMGTFLGRSVQSRLATNFLQVVYRKMNAKMPDKARVIPVVHHLAHAASAYYFSGFASCAAITVDGNGETDSTVVWKVVNGEFERVGTVDLAEGSLGVLYDTIATRLGFQTIEAAGKAMGLAPYGAPREELAKKFGKIATVSQGGDRPYLFSDAFRKQARAYTAIADYVTSGLDLRWDTHAGVSGDVADLAWQLQHFTEQMMISIARWAKAATGEKSVALAGGVALNAKANMELYYSGLFDRMFVFPAANDSGAPIGAAAYVYRNVLGGKMANERIEQVFLGPEYPDEVISSAISRSKWRSQRIGSDTNPIADIVAKGGVVGWFQGRSELGPRALGNRSIIADPRKKDNWALVNGIKGREPWRPLAPSVRSGEESAYFENPTDARFMILMLRMTHDASQRVPAVCHVDGTSRPQVVSREDNAPWHDLLSSFKSATGEGMLLNTSFNLGGEPLVQTPAEALRSFAVSGLDALYLQGWLIRKAW
jgi:carbamoyltransferase